MDARQQAAVEEAVRQAESRCGELLKLLGDLIACPTVSPPARNAAGAQRFLAAELQKLGFETDLWDVYPGDPNLVACRKGSGEGRYASLILNGHIDVAEVGDASGWTCDPFRLTERDGRVYGRGTADMKGGLAACVFAVRLLAEAGFDFRGDLQIQSVIGEEAGEAGTQQCIERGYRADFAVVADTSNLALQGQGGVITGWITVQSPVTHHDGMRSRMIHAGGGVHGASAIEKMMKIIASLQELERHWAVTKAYPGFPPGTNTINPAVIEGGRHAAFVADRCALWITVHFYPDEDYESVAREIEEHVLRTAAADPWLRENPPLFRWGGKSMIEERGEVFPALPLNTGHPGIRMLAECHSRQLGRPPVLEMSPSVTDAGWFGRAGIPTVIYGPGELRHAHAVDEHVPVRQLIDYTQTMVRFIAAWSSTLKEAVQAGLEGGRAG